jgi:hypothetical protein
MGGPPGFSEGVLICEAGVVGVKKPFCLIGAPLGVVTALLLLMLDMDRFNFVGDMTRLELWKIEKKGHILICVNSAFRAGTN